LAIRDNPADNCKERNFEMPKKKATPETQDESSLVHAAKTIGAAVGKIAKLAGVKPEPAQSQKVPKLAKKEKHRLPRREKKALQKSS
jgi:hypothetical protein